MQEHFHFLQQTKQTSKSNMQTFSSLSRLNCRSFRCMFSIQLSFGEARRCSYHCIIVIHILRKLFGFTSEHAQHRFVIGSLFSKHRFLERFRYHCRCRSLRFAIKWVRHELARRDQHRAYAVVDRLPFELCHVARMCRVKRFQGITNVSYCVSKKQWYDGFKFHLQMTD